MISQKLFAIDQCLRTRTLPVLDALKDLCDVIDIDGGQYRYDLFSYQSTTVSVETLKLT